MLSGIFSVIRISGLQGTTVPYRGTCFKRQDKKAKQAPQGKVKKST